MRLNLLAFSALALAAAASAEPPDAAARHPRWAHTWKEALAEAKLRGVPILVAYGSDT